MTWADLEERLAAELDERLFATGGQLYVSVGGQVVVDTAMGVDGLDRPVDQDMLFAIYCCGKPAVALAFATLVEEGEVSWDDELGDLLDAPLTDEIASVPIGCILNHTAGLHQLHPMTYMTLPSEARRMLLSTYRLPAGWQVGSQVAYSQSLGWHVLGMVLRSLRAEPVRELVRRRVLEPLGVAADMHVAGMPVPVFEAERGRIGVNALIEGRSRTPILSERLRRFRCLDDPASAATGNARALGRFYEGLLAILHGSDGPVAGDTLRELISPQSHFYGYGFMVRLADHGFSARCGSHAFGHSAYGGMSLSFCDPGRDLVVACHFNGWIDAESAVSWRHRLIDQIYRSIS